MNETAYFRVNLPGLTTENLAFVEAQSKFDLTLYSRDRGDDIHFNLVYRTDLFTESWVRCFLQQYSWLLAQIVDAPEQRVGSYSLVTNESREFLPDPAAVIEEPLQRLVTEIFFSWAQKSPLQTAVSQGEHSWTYEQLAERADAIGRFLKHTGLKTGDVVAVYGRRSAGLVASMLGTLVSGGALLLIDCQLPDERKRLMLKEARARSLLLVGVDDKDWLDAAQATESFSIESMTGAVIDADSSLNLKTVSLPKVSPEDPAYLFFTSGTTGTPKAVLGCHKGLSHFLCWQRETFGIEASDRIAQLTNISFDPVLRDVFLPLTSGATVCLPEDDLEDGDRIEWLQRERISVLHIVPSLANAWLSCATRPCALNHLRWVFFTGEPLTDTLVRQWRSTCLSSGEIVNLYGPTETTLVKCFYRVPAEPRPGIQPVGLPIPGAQALVLAHNKQLCGINEPGEIVIRTPFRTLGYMDSEESAGRFLRNPFREDPEDVVYFTGDAGRYRSDGMLEILGRIDDQVKVRGVRVEPAEVTAILSQHPFVKDCIVVGKKNAHGETCLVAYVVILQDGSTTTAAQLRSYLLGRLPVAIVPSMIVLLDALPLAPNGKVDRNALPEPDHARQTGDSFSAPRSDLEKVLAGIWAEVLKLEKIGVHDNFFDAGGHSLLAIRVLSRVTQAFHLTIPLKVLFESPTVAEMAEVIEQNQARTAMPSDLERLVTDLENMSEFDAQRVLADQSLQCLKETT
jgi:amino acid adenylation domain-containing protein